MPPTTREARKRSYSSILVDNYEQAMVTDPRENISFPAVKRMRIDIQDAVYDDPGMVMRAAARLPGSPHDGRGFFCRPLRDNNDDDEDETCEPCIEVIDKMCVDHPDVIDNHEDDPDDDQEDAQDDSDDELDEGYYEDMVNDHNHAMDRMDALIAEIQELGNRLNAEIRRLGDDFSDDVIERLRQAIAKVEQGRGEEVQGEYFEPEVEEGDLVDDSDDDE